ncbi:methionine adenosyltransferase (plasmid) [Rhizobium leguminosarum]|uniref:methionine adenosyltransferase n=1 Tax=Rhizobium leguminosarum TaxID=384 RepID=UPI000486E24D|nr:methionine adenosyltransferase [Rhizobium leguminosarum]UIK01176.1 methionine adenosyltransferase [Rhizobium leguminosarum]UIK14092.1 methionine adenosyltransferase [Rhizobium leguminosarum]UIL30226.1 methionine adenosyltransferase [Rhizobium leguminosarum]WFT90860.1 methionine adenosyltransferase [Rhizobium leguminosarum]
MTTTFESAPQFYFTSESVTEGHPDKIADQISDAILDAHLEHGGDPRVACETVVKGGLTIIVGEVKSDASVDYEGIARKVIKEIGYSDPVLGFDSESSVVLTSLVRQSPDYLGKIDHAVDFESSGSPDIEPIGAGDQGIMTGFASDETPELMPLPITLAHGLTRRLAEVRKNGTLPYLRPDGKSQVTVEYAHGQPVRVDTILVLAHHDESIDAHQLERDLRVHVVDAVVPHELLDERTKFYSNPTGRFVHGGPAADSGLTGRKLQVDTYGGFARHGGGAFSGKDATKVDRSGAYAARWVAKNVVAAGLARRFELQVSYAVAMARPLSVSFETFGTHEVAPERIRQAILDVFDLRPGAIIQELGLRKVRYRPVAAYGHFGRSDLDLPWERTDQVSALRAAAGLT